MSFISFSLVFQKKKDTAVLTLYFIRSNLILVSIINSKRRPPTFNFEKSDSRENVMVWSIIFLDGNVNGGNYLHMLNERVLPYLFQRFGKQLQDGFFQRLWWAQDGASRHRTQDVTAWLTEFFVEKVIALYREVEWPPRFTDLTHVTFFSGGT